MVPNRSQEAVSCIQPHSTEYAVPFASSPMFVLKKSVILACIFTVYEMILHVLHMPPARLLRISQLARQSPCTEGNSTM